MTTAIIGTGGLGLVIARQLASGGESLRLSSAQLGRAGPVRQRNCSAPTSACAAAPRRCAGPCSCRKRV